MKNPGKAKNGSNGYTFSIPGQGTLLLPRPTSPGQECRMGFQDFDGYYVEGAAEPSIGFSQIQWVNPDRRSRDQDNLSTTGGFFSDDQFPGSRPCFFITEAGEKVDGWGASELEFVILAKRQRWISKDDGIFQSYFDCKERIGEARAKHGRSHVQIAIRIRGDDQIRVFGLKGTASSVVPVWIKNLEAVAAAATRFARKKDPKKPPMSSYMFGAKYHVGPAMITGKEGAQKTIHPPAQAPIGKDLKDLISAWTGPDLSLENGHWILDVGRIWIRQWQYSIGNATVAEMRRNGNEDGDPPPPDDGDAPPSGW